MSSPSDNIINAAVCAAAKVPAYPILAPWVQHVPLDDERSQLVGHNFSLSLKHKFLNDAFVQVRPYLTGEYPSEEIIKKVKPPLLPTTALFVLKMLAENSLLMSEQAKPAISTNTRDLALFFAQASLGEIGPALDAVKAFNVHLIGDSRICGELRNQFTRLEIPHAPFETTTAAKASGAKPDLIILALDSHSPHQIHQLNSTAVHRGYRWMLVFTAGGYGQVGPTFIPSQTACYECLTLRAGSQTDSPDEFARVADYLARTVLKFDCGGASAFDSLLASHVALEVLRLATGYAAPQTIGKFHEIRSDCLTVETHEVLKVPRCRVCGPRQAAKEVWDFGIKEAT
jgi:bacteriocin biosynthesis cyclodehydratase domain-containing protein